MKKITTRLMCFLIRSYQICISPLFPQSCRFYPSCSNYAIDSIRKHGPLKGVFFALKRVLRCHPFSVGGYDPVP